MRKGKSEMDARLGTVVELVPIAAILVMALLYLRRRGMSTRRMLGILVAGFSYTLLVLILRLFGVPSDTWAVILLGVIAFLIGLAGIAWERWRRSRTW